ncbi:secreted RxLR effector protein 161-like [Apium graveolens]|uniref:secreted RxLR effector protein 161-like n=1 Tax=Apium graveolens TaxID=4045 RepID=UPI003D78E4B3
MKSKLRLCKGEHGKSVNSTDFKSLVGGLRYLVHTRPDIAYASCWSSEHIYGKTCHNAPECSQENTSVCTRTVEFGLVYLKGQGDYLLSGFSDSYLAGNLDDRKSTTGVAFYLNDSLVTWISQKQRWVALSSCEAEFMAVTAASCQAIWLRNVLNQITDGGTDPVVLYVDNKSAIDLAKNPVFHGHSKHIHIRFHFIRECVERGDIIIKYVGTEQQKADVLTKAMCAVKFEQMRKLLGVKNLQKNNLA